MRTRARTDSNHTEVVHTLRYAGCLVQSLASVGKGVFDLLVCCPRGRLYVLEVKSEKGELTDAQDSWYEQWCRSPQVRLVRSASEALEAVGLKGSNR